MERKSWDEYFLTIAEAVATRSTCNRLNVGCVIVKDKHIISTGYNGSIHGHEHCDEAGCLLSEQGRCIRCLHAELNAVLHAERDKLKGASAYVTHEPCENCAKTLAQAGIERIVYRNAYPNKWNSHFLKDIDVLHVPSMN
ncbi:cytidine/deoxycytidylate deaminase family protein [Bacillus sp. 37MA]|uniref:deoxycytidylate deaminase n=1 Tax=Bacillus sp. 37MA TaxID=1132442 RepID=UPI00037081C7|nr:cytidine/deoxycytidylate deaminase family protein [Bacillus sp. 37MA]